MAPPATEGHALPPSLGVREARDRYLSENGFTVDAYHSDTFQIDLAGRTWTLRNYRARRRVIPLHDLQHVVTGYGTDLVGESEQSAWELRAGIRSWFLWWFKLSAVAIGLVMSPRRVCRAFQRARGHRSLYIDTADYDELLGLTLGELRQRLGVPPQGLADRPPRRHRRAPG